MARARQKAENPPARLIGELRHLRQDFREAHATYGRQVEGGIERLVEALQDPPKTPTRKKGETPTVKPSALHDIEKMLAVVKALTFKPHKGRRKDLRHVEHLVSTFLTRVDE